MSHRRVYSQGSIPFSWEHKPGISKVTNPDCLIIDGTNLQVLNLKPSSLQPPSLPSNSRKLDATTDRKIPLPPCPLSSQPPRRSTSSKDNRWQDDPFLVAYKECTKTVKSGDDGKLPSDQDGGKNSFAIVSKGSRKKSRSLFLCKNSCDARDDNFIKMSNLPPLPRKKIHSLW